MYFYHMRRMKPVLLTSLLTLTIFVSVLFISCEKSAIKYNDTTLVRPCEDVVCLNGGACSDGVCHCAYGFEGVHCETKWSDKFIGTYKASDECYTGSNQYYLVNILPVPNYSGMLNIQNLGTACPGTSFVATINPEKTTFHIAPQSTCGNIYISGEGNMNGQYINIYLVQRDSVNHVSTNCSIVLDKQ